MFSGLDRMRGEQWCAAGAPEDADHEPRPDARLRRRELETIQWGAPGYAEQDTGDSKYWKYTQPSLYQYKQNHQLLLSLGQAQLAEVKKAIQEVNWSRKNQQTQVPKNFLILFI